jgi:hypothetical protein
VQVSGAGHARAHTATEEEACTRFLSTLPVTLERLLFIEVTQIFMLFSAASVVSDSSSKQVPGFVRADL